jgi:hypothetical protein
MASNRSVTERVGTTLIGLGIMLPVALLVLAKGEFGWRGVVFGAVVVAAPLLLAGWVLLAVGRRR